MDINLTQEELSFQTEVKGFLSENAHKPGTDYNEWRLNWFKEAASKGGWDLSLIHI